MANQETSDFNAEQKRVVGRAMYELTKVFSLQQVDAVTEFITDTIMDRIPDADTLPNTD